MGSFEGMTGDVPQRNTARIGECIVIATVAGTAFAYSFNLVSFLHAKDLMLAIGAFALSILMVFRAPNSTMVSWKLWPLLALLALHIAISAVHFGDLSFDNRQLFVWMALALFGWNAFLYMHTEESRARVVSAVILTAGIAAVLGIIQFTGLLEVLFPAFNNSLPIYSVFGNSGLLGGYLAIAIPLLLRKYFEDERFKIAYLFACAVLLAAMLLTGARTAWLACAAAVSAPCAPCA